VRLPETTLATIVAVLRARVWLVALLAVPVLVLSIGYAATREPVYRSDVVLSFKPDVGSSSGTSFLRLVRRYQLVATSSDALRSAERRAGLSQGALTGAVAVESPGDTLQLGVAVQTSSVAESERGAAAVADVVVEITGRDPLVAAERLIGPTEATDVTPTRQMMAVAAGVVVGLVPGVGLAFVLEGARPRLRTRRDVVTLGVTLLLTLSRRTLLESRAGQADRIVGLPALRAELDLRAGGRRRPVVLVSPSPADSDLVHALARALAPPLSGVPAPVVRPGLLADAEAVAAVRKHGRVVLVLPTGTRADLAEDCVELVRRLGAELVGGVLIR
jgi:capsular polysaccharide biosynthesis protein